MTSPNLAFISLGSNIDPERYLPRAIQSLHSLGKILKVSRVYQNPALDRPEQPDFLNAAVLIETNLEALTIRQRLREIEAEHDRVRSEDKYAPRTLDLDLCLLGSMVHLSSEFSLPDPDILKRAHLAIPLAELNFDFIHPTTSTTLGAIAEAFQPVANLTYREDITLLVQKEADSQNE
jgi:2-amino-4-hydroxy-6-hydroxymethyldihydropteridine diphosphokinase